jgi:choice-of-anchor B domain-containing protein
MKTFYWIVIAVFYSIESNYAQNFQIDSLSHVNYINLHDTQLNDIWGYTDELGNEYALVGARKGTSIVKITPPSSPVEVAWFPDSVSIWRDLSSWQNFAYVTTEAEAGLFIIDLNPLPASAPVTTAFYKGPITNPWQSAHTLFVDNAGYAYIFGANRGNGGVIILDVHTDPMNPIEVGVFDNWYVHDGYARNDTLWCANIGEGFVSIIDISDRANPVLIATHTTPSNFTHNVWPNDAGNVIFTTDETTNSFLTAYDVTDPNNLVELDRIQDLPGSGTVIHNVHIRGNYAISSYYSSGIVVHDISRPTNIVEVGSFDTYPGISTHTRGCWGAFPFFASGTVLATDMENGLYILHPNYQPARYIEGNVTNATTLLPLQGVSITIAGDEQIEISKLNGNYATGIASGSFAMVTFFKVGFYTQTHMVPVLAGQVTVQNVAMVPIPVYTVNVQVNEFGGALQVNNAFVRFTSDLTKDVVTTDGLGHAVLALQYETNYEIQIEKWGKEPICTTIYVSALNANHTFEMNIGYFDSFTFDHGWTAFGTATSGDWERGELTQGHTYTVLPVVDFNSDCGNEVYVTGNSTNIDPDFDDVDGGFVKLVSPIFDATIYPVAYLTYARSFFCGFINAPNDTLTVSISNGITEVVIEKLASGFDLEGLWIPVTRKISDLISPTNSMSINFSVSDGAYGSPTANLTEAAVDYFRLSPNDVTLVPELTEVNTKMKLFPNPSNGLFELQFPETAIGQEFHIYNQQGEIIYKDVVKKDTATVNLQEMANGLYFINLRDETLKIVIH